MIQDIFIGAYIPGDSALHRLDPRTKLAGMVIILGTVFLLKSPLNQGIACVATAAIAVLTAAGVRIWFWSLKRFVWMLVFATAANVLFVREGTAMTAGTLSLPFTDEGLRKGFFFTLQLAEAIVLSMCLTFTTSPIQITRACRRLSRPLRRFLPVEEIGLVLLLAMRFVPLLQQELRYIVDAQKSRGVEFGRGGPAIRAANLAAVLVPAVSNTLRRADILAEAMAARGFQPGQSRSEYEPLQFRSLDGKAGALVVLYLVIQSVVIMI
ncbi:MAG: energy-coupling factor transporter transmembrane protein EcfT [Desulfomonile tiedjei]|uniref:Energy-coupling factor transporter transmembrane protein EcfT n=1 Tax=Desulfomonile tiedjei TaxID=2358 RepID=A0A9D6V3T9_9BACT|nr:energy-coupling factor transporter transmembrane protein EcfT [Desulfomonile tiedjei]